MSTKKIHFNWKLLVMRVLVNGLTIALTAFLVAGIDLVNESLLMSIIVVGAVFGIINALIKPIVQLLTISLLFVSYGFIIIFINTVMLIILAWLLPNYLFVSGLWTAILGGALMGVISVFVENLLGMSPPIIDVEQPRLKEPDTLISLLK